MSTYILQIGEAAAPPQTPDFTSNFGDFASFAAMIADADYSRGGSTATYTLKSDAGQAWGDYYVRQDYPGDGTSYDDRWYWDPSRLASGNYRTISVRVWFRFASNWGTTSDIKWFAQAANGSHPRWIIKPGHNSNTQKIRLRKSGSGSSAERLMDAVNAAWSNLYNGNWHELRIRMVKSTDDVTADGVFRASIDGTILDTTDTSDGGSGSDGDGITTDVTGVYFGQFEIMSDGAPSNGGTATWTDIGEIDVWTSDLGDSWLAGG